MSSFVYGYGGLGAGATFVEFAGLNRMLREHDSVWGGHDTFDIRPPLWSFSGHGAAEVGSLTIGGWGAFGFLSYQAESTGTELIAAQAAFEVGYPYAPVKEFWIRPCLDIGPGTWCHLIHSQEPGRSNHFRWHLGWVLAAAPGIELAARLRSAESTYVGVYVKGSYTFPFIPTEWYGDASPPDFVLKGLQVQFGLRFGRMAASPFRM
uniref:Outer membrane protein beta-barrel domain-containing protein n=1 Tax=candidate division WOR-3 bacterium TaxID=2052148 RepID=A0A7C4GBV4_UNCW3